MSKYKRNAKKNIKHYEGTNRKKKIQSSNLPKKITINGVDIFDGGKIANEFIKQWFG